MIDLHCHLCFGVDDGPKNAAEAVALAKGLAKAGVHKVACTSHLRPDKKWFNDAGVQIANHQALSQAMDDAGVVLERVRGAEHYLDAELLPALQAGRGVPFSNTRWLLVELPYQGKPPDLLGLLFSIRRLGFRVLLAHAERFPYLVDDGELLNRVVQAGHALQINLGSLSGVYHRAHKKAARTLLKAQLVAVAAGDCHRAADVAGCIEKGQKALLKLVGAQGVKRLTVDNPQKILEDAAAEDLGLT